MPEAAPPTPPSLAFDTPAGFATAVQAALAQALAAPARRIEWCDADFVDWPLDDPDFIDALTRWARGPARELVMVAADFEALQRRHSRFVRWRRDWAHVITCLSPPERPPGDELPTLWIDAGGQVLRVFDRVRWRGRLGADRHDRQQAREQFDAIAQRAAPAFSPTTLGL